MPLRKRSQRELARIGELFLERERVDSALRKLLSPRKRAKRARSLRGSNAPVIRTSALPLTVREAAKRIGTSRDTVWRMVRRGELRAFRKTPSGPFFIYAESVSRFCASMGVPQVSNSAEAVQA